MKALSKSIGALMKEGKAADAEAAKQKVADIKVKTKELEARMATAEADMNQLLYTIPNVPYDIVPEGNGAEDNLVVKTGGHDTVLPENPLPHWELAKKYNLIDFDLGVKITGAGFPVYIGQGARLQRALIDFSLMRPVPPATRKSCLPLWSTQRRVTAPASCPTKKGRCITVTWMTST